MKAMLLLFFVFQSITAIGQSTAYKINLAQDNTGLIKKTVASDKLFEVIIENKLPNVDYDVRITKSAIPIEELELPSTDAAMTLTGGGASQCAAFIALVEGLLDIKKEQDLPEKVAEITKEMTSIRKALETKNPTDEGCSRSNLSEASAILNSTWSQIGEWTLNRGEQLEVVISREVDDEIKKWVYIYTTEARGSFQLSYGFSFITQGFSKENVFFSSVTGDAYTITKEHNRRSLSYAPSIFFTWLGAGSLNRNFSLGLSGGLGFDMENPTVFINPTISFNQNIKFHAGLAFHKQDVLLGKYSEGQIINENLTRDQLHESVYKVNPFVSLSFRFNETPFRQTQ